MPINTKSTARTDGIDLDRFQQMLDSPQFQMFWVKVQSEYNRAAQACIRTADVTEVHRAQGAAAALGAVLSFPKMIRDSMKAK